MTKKICQLVQKEVSKVPKNRRSNSTNTASTKGISSGRGALLGGVESPTSASAVKLTTSIPNQAI
jgi:hypothetical protein